MLADINYRITNRNTHALTEIFIDNKNHVPLAARDQQEHSKDGQMANNTKKDLYKESKRQFRKKNEWNFN